MPSLITRGARSSNGYGGKYVDVNAYSLSYVGKKNYVNNDGFYDGISTAFQFLTVGLGNPVSSREIFVLAAVRSNTTTITSATIGGVTATISSNSSYASTTYVRLYLIRAAVPSGATGHVILNASDTNGTASILVYRVTGRPNAPASETSYLAVTTSGSQTFSPTTPNNGFSLMFASESSSNTATAGSPYVSDDSTYLTNDTVYRTKAWHYSRLGSSSDTPSVSVTAEASGSLACWSFN